MLGEEEAWQIGRGAGRGGRGPEPAGRGAPVQGRGAQLFFSKTGGLSVMSTRQLFDFVTSSVIEDTEEFEAQALDDIMLVVEKGVDRLSKLNAQDRKRCLQKEKVYEAVFMSQFLPQSLNQIAEVDIQTMETGEVEETYAEAVAALWEPRCRRCCSSKQRQIAQEKNGSEKCRILQLWLLVCKR